MPPPPPFPIGSVLIASPHGIETYATVTATSTTRRLTRRPWIQVAIATHNFGADTPTTHLHWLHRHQTRPKNLTVHPPTHTPTS